MTTPLVSIVLPFFNARSTLARAIESILEQSCKQWELILVNDGSTDDSSHIARDFASNDNRIRLIESNHAGIVAALQNGCSEVRAAMIARMDADDYAMPDRLEMQLELMNANPDMGLCGTLVTTTGDAGEGRLRYEQWLNSIVEHDDMVRELYVECPVPHPTFMMRRDAFEAVGGYEEHGWAEDYDLCMRIYGAGYGLGKVDKALLEWHQSPDRLSMNDDRYSLAQFRALKMHYLTGDFLDDWAEFYQWGAGEVGKAWLRDWADRKPAAVVDINPRKIGKVIHGTIVIWPQDLPQPGKCRIVVAVGAPGARIDIRDWFSQRGYVERNDYVFIA